MLVAKLQSFERHIAQLEGWLQGSEMLESKKMKGQLHHHQETTSGISDTLATVNTTITAAVCVFHKFVPDFPFYSCTAHQFSHSFTRKFTARMGQTSISVKVSQPMG